MIEVFRVAPDGLSREVWNFREAGGHRAMMLLLDHYSIERRKQPKGRYARATAMDRWNSSDERHYTSGLPRPISVPDDVMREAISKSVIEIHVGWTTDASLIGRFTIAAQGIETEGRDGETRLGAKHESPVGKADAP